MHIIFYKHPQKRTFFLQNRIKSEKFTYTSTIYNYIYIPFKNNDPLNIYIYISVNQYTIYHVHK